ncbi:MAG: M28 family peptidase, partial [Opitutaceae bacterium]
FGGRLTGSPASRAAMDALVNELRALGLKPERQNFTMPGWVRGDDEVTLVAPLPSPRRLRVAALSYTQPHEPFEADIVDIGQGRDEDFAKIEVRGKVGLLAANTTVPRGLYEKAAVERGMRGVLFINREAGGQLLARTGAFSGEPVKIPVYSLAQEEGRWIGRLLARGQKVRVRLHTRSHCESIETTNLIVRFPGRTAEKIIIGAHFDSWDLGQGAMDNGIGLAQLFSIAKYLAAHPAERLHPIELIWYNGEEQGLWGSRYAAAAAHADPIAVMVNLDMVGYPLSVNACGAAELLPSLTRFSATMPVERLREGVKNVAWLASDHTPYQLAGINVITFGAFIDREVNRYYHDVADTFDKSDPKLLAESAATIGALTLFLADDPSLSANRHSPAEVAELVKIHGLAPRLTAMGLWPLPVVSGVR